MTVTQSDVALRAGVSVRTVSNVVNDFPLVADTTRERVQQAIHELGYRPNLSARNLRQGRSGLIGLAVPKLSVPYFSELAVLVVEEAGRRGYTVVIEQTDGDIEREQRLLSESERSHLFDGLILSPLGEADIREVMRGAPVVFLGEHAVDGPHDHVGIDNVAAAQEATTHLISLGRQRIAAIGHQSGPPGRTGELRTTGYRHALREGRLPFRSELMVPTVSFRRSSGAAAMEQLLALDKPPDGVFCYSDLLAIGAMRTALSRGCRIPDDIAIVGFDDIEEGRYSFPSLSTISPDKQDIAREAVERIFARLRNPALSPSLHVAGHHLIARESSLGDSPAPGSPFQRADRL